MKLLGERHCIGAIDRELSLQARSPKYAIEGDDALEMAEQTGA